MATLTKRLPGRASVRRSFVDACQPAYQAPAASDQFCIAGSQVDHQVSVGLAQANHGGGGNAVQDQFGGSAGFHARRSADNFGTNDRADNYVGQGFHFTARVAKPRRRTGHQFDARTSSRHDTRSSAAGRNAYNNIARLQLQIFQIGCAQLRVVFGALDRAAQRRIASRDDTHDQFGRRTECRWTFAGVQHSQSADVPRPCKSIFHPSERLLDNLHGSRNLHFGRGHGFDNAPILAIDQPDDFQSMPTIDFLRSGIDRFGS